MTAWREISDPRIKAYPRDAERIMRDWPSARKWTSSDAKPLRRIEHECVVDTYHARSQAATLAIECVPQPDAFRLGRTPQPEALNLERYHLESGELPRADIDHGEVRERQIVAELVVSRDPLVVREKVAAAVEDDVPAIHLDPLRVMRGMPVDDIDPRAIDERVRESAVRVRYGVAPVATPVNRRDR